MLRRPPWCGGGFWVTAATRVRRRQKVAAACWASLCDGRKASGPRAGRRQEWRGTVAVLTAVCNGYAENKFSWRVPTPARAAGWLRVAARPRHRSVGRDRFLDMDTPET